jgi:hypothetical protein
MQEGLLRKKLFFNALLKIAFNQAMGESQWAWEKQAPAAGAAGPVYYILRQYSAHEGLSAVLACEDHSLV